MNYWQRQALTRKENHVEHEDNHLRVHFNDGTTRTFCQYEGVFEAAFPVDVKAATMITLVGRPNPLKPGRMTADEDNTCNACVDKLSHKHFIIEDENEQSYLDKAYWRDAHGTQRISDEDG
jgi:hypothetical protein